jgi:hypothetical protein
MKGKPSQWTKTPHDPKAPRFRGNYVTSCGRRRLQLSHPTNSKRVFTYDSWQSAKLNGWTKVR